MKKLLSIALIFIVSAFISIPLFALETRAKAPRVAYIAPNDESIVDLTDKQFLTFRWSSQPIPPGGRESYKIIIYKGFSYDIVVGEVLDPKTFSMDIPAEKFEDGKIYSWHVKQRDAGSLQWSRFDSWSFKVLKK